MPPHSYATENKAIYDINGAQQRGEAEFLGIKRFHEVFKHCFRMPFSGGRISTKLGNILKEAEGKLEQFSTIILVIFCS